MRSYPRDGRESILATSLQRVESQRVKFTKVPAIIDRLQRGLVIRHEQTLVLALLSAFWTEVVEMVRIGVVVDRNVLDAVLLRLYPLKVYEASIFIVREE